MNGLIIIDKPAGKTSHAVVQDVRKMLDARKAGHTGTLDPMATGVLPVCINEATKLAQFFSGDGKEYRVRMLLGVQTDTYDLEGTILAEEEPRIAEEEIERVMLSLVGKRRQVPPPFSAVKYQGKPLYSFARRGITVLPAPRTIEIYSLDLKNIDLPYVDFSISCSKGTYIRSLCVEVGAMLGCGACLAFLRRTKSGRYTEDRALPLAALTLRSRREVLDRHLIPMADALPGLLAFPVDGPLAEKLRQGYQPVADDLRAHHIPFFAAGDMVRFIAGSRLVAIARMRYPSDQLPLVSGQEPAVRIMRVFHGE